MFRQPGTSASITHCKHLVILVFSISCLPQFSSSLEYNYEKESKTNAISFKLCFLASRKQTDIAILGNRDRITRNCGTRFPNLIRFTSSKWLKEVLTMTKPHLYPYIRNTLYFNCGVLVHFIAQPRTFTFQRIWRNFPRVEWAMIQPLSLVHIAMSVWVHRNFLV